ncbi:MAG: hypothetical protein ACRC42_03140 [Mycoplasma sp.]
MAIENNWIGSEINLIKKTFTVPASQVDGVFLDDDGNKICKSGTIFTKPYLGLLLQDTKVGMIGTVVVGGVYIDEELPESTKPIMNKFIKNGLFPLNKLRYSAEIMTNDKVGVGKGVYATSETDGWVTVANEFVKMKIIGWDAVVKQEDLINYLVATTDKYIIKADEQTIYHNDEALAKVKDISYKLDRALLTQSESTINNFIGGVAGLDKIINAKQNELSFKLTSDNQIIEILSLVVNDNASEKSIEMFIAIADNKEPRFIQLHFGINKSTSVWFYRIHQNSLEYNEAIAFDFAGQSGDIIEKFKLIDATKFKINTIIKYEDFEYPATYKKDTTK